MVKRNSCLARLNAGYLFPEINKRKKAAIAKFPEAEFISLGIGDTTVPIPFGISQSMAEFAKALATEGGYSGYGLEQGNKALREKIAERIYKKNVQADDIFISDGAKCDIGRLQLLFGKDVSIAVQHPTYPVYVDSSVILGQTGSYNKNAFHYDGITYMECLPENNFFPNLEALPRTDLIYFCSPNNPTGAASTSKQLKALVDFAKQNRSIIIFDAAYAAFIQDKALPRSIYEIEGAEEVAIELGSFSKLAGFTGLRLGWSIVPKTICFDDGTPVQNDWNRLVSTLFNGASNIVQAGGLATLEEENYKQISAIVAYYMENAKVIKNALENLGLPAYGGTNAPYVWAKFEGKSSWDIFEAILEKTHIVTTPGLGFGSAGESFIRFSAFGNTKNIFKAAKRLNLLHDMINTSSIPLK